MKYAVRFPYGKTIHILDAHGIPLCKSEIHENAVFYFHHPNLKNNKVCSKCCEAIGRMMADEYLRRLGE